MRSEHLSDLLLRGNISRNTGIPDGLLKPLGAQLHLFNKPFLGLWCISRHTLMTSMVAWPFLYALDLNRRVMKTGLISFLAFEIRWRAGWERKWQLRWSCKVQPLDVTQTGQRREAVSSTMVRPSIRYINCHVHKLFEGGLCGYGQCAGEREGVCAGHGSAVSREGAGASRGQALPVPVDVCQEFSLCIP